MWVKCKNGSYVDTDSSSRVVVNQMDDGVGHRVVLRSGTSVTDHVVMDEYLTRDDAQAALDEFMTSQHDIVLIQAPVEPDEIDEDASTDKEGDDK